MGRPAIFVPGRTDAVDRCGTETIIFLPAREAAFYS